MDSKKIVVVGNSYAAGAVFYYLQTYLQKSRVQCELLLISDSGFYFYRELLPEFLSGNCEINDVTQEFRNIGTLRSGIRYLKTSVINVDFKKKNIITTKGIVEYDYLILAPTLDFDKREEIKMVNSNLFNFNTPYDVISVKNHILNLLESYSSESNLAYKKELLTFTLIGADKHGFEAACALSDFVCRRVKKQYPEINRDQISIYLIDKEKTVSLSESAFYNNYLFYCLNKKGVKLLLDHGIEQISNKKIIFRNGKQITSHTIINCIKPVYSELMVSLLFEKDKSFKADVDLYFKTDKDSNVFVIGEASRCVDLREDINTSIIFYKEQAKKCAYNVFSSINNNPLSSFKHSLDMSYICIGRNNSIVAFQKFYFTGYIAYLIYRLLFVFSFLGYLKKLRAMIRFILSQLWLQEPVLYEDAFSSEVSSEKVLIKKG